MQEQTLESAHAFVTDASRWQALCERNSIADGVFYYGVTTTGIYCRPTCPSRLAKQEHVSYFATPEEAEQAGYRACKRCKPRAHRLTEQHASLVIQACRTLEEPSETESLSSLARAAGLSKHHFHRLFKAHTGLTPKAYADMQRGRRVREALQSQPSVTSALYEAGFNSSGRFYAAATGMLGMHPTRYAAGGVGMQIRFSVGECRLGSILVACTAVGVCAIFLGDERDALIHELEQRFHKAELVAGDDAFQQHVAYVIGILETPDAVSRLPLDICGTVFQQHVWQALREIPPGTTVSYRDIAQRIGKPRAMRAVAAACGANPIAVAIPCHRVIRSDGSLSGYRWGIDRKSALLEKERGESA